MEEGAGGPSRIRSRPGIRSRALLLGLAALITAVLPGCTPLDDAMVAVFGRSMRSQPSFDPYENPRPAPENSVPFAAANFPAAAGEVNIGQPERGAFPPPFEQGDVLQQNPVVMELENPVPATAASRERGEVLYRRYCAVCHGDAGVGAEAYISDVHPVLAAYNLAGETVQGYPDGYIYGIMRTGRGLMPSYAHALTHFDRWHVVNYIRELQGLLPEEGGAGGGGE